MNFIFENPDTEKLIIYISKNFPYSAFCGSFALNYYGAIQRPIHDLDICVPLKYEKEAIRFFNILKYGISSPQFIWEKPKSNYLKMSIKKIDFCIFFKPIIDCLIVSYKDIDIKLSHIEDIIKAKDDYSKKTDCDGYFLKGYQKHIKDLNNYNKRKNQIDRLIKTSEILGKYKIYKF